MDDHFASAVAYVHRHEHFDHAAGLETIEAVECCSRPVRREALWATVEASGEDGLMPRSRRRSESEHARRYALDDSIPYKTCKPRVSHVTFARLNTCEEP